VHNWQTGGNFKSATILDNAKIADPALGFFVGWWGCFGLGMEAKTPQARLCECGVAADSPTAGDSGGNPQYKQPACGLIQPPRHRFACHPS